MDELFIIDVRSRSGRPEWVRLLDTGRSVSLPVQAAGRRYWMSTPIRWRRRPAGPVKCPACHRPFYEPVRRVCRACGLDLADIQEEGRNMSERRDVHNYIQTPFGLGPACERKGIPEWCGTELLCPVCWPPPSPPAPVTHYATDVHPADQPREGRKLELPAGSEWVGDWEPVGLTCDPAGRFFILWRRAWRAPA